MASMAQEEAWTQSEGGKPPFSLPSCDSLSVPKGYPPVFSDYCPATVEGCWWEGSRQSLCKSLVNESQESAAREQPLLWGLVRRVGGLGPGSRGASSGGLSFHPRRNLNWRWPPLMLPLCNNPLFLQEALSV